MIQWLNTGGGKIVGQLMKYVDGLSDGLSSSILVEKVVTAMGPDPGLISDALLPLVLSMQERMGTVPEETEQPQQDIFELINSMGVK